ncbi:MAG: FecR family protein [Candidatus Electrothrix sp. GW3-4]|uniref:FecR family protein n=1 Tax=Candidatus Electrothrix sp. GW3-4 TaxID=3126740 RepID=UPI0030CB7153
MPITLSLLRKVITVGMIFLLPTTSFSIDSSTLLQFLGTEHTPRVSLLPTSLPLADSFKPGTNPYAGTVAQIQGTAYVYHQGGTVAYKLMTNIPLFSGDTLVTGEKSRITLQMADDTILSLAAQTKLTIDKSLPRMKVRDTVLQLFFGRIRALVKKLAGEYIINTPNSSVGVRGTDFAVVVALAPKSRMAGWRKKVPAGLLTAVLTGQAPSTVELVGRFGSSIMVKPFSVAGIATGSRAEEAMYVGPAAIPLLQQIAPQEAFQSYLPKKPAPAAAPCWPFSGTAKGLTYFKVCTPGEKPSS